MKLMVLDKKDKWKVHKDKVDEETTELIEAIDENNLDHIAEETLDNIQVCVGILDKLYHKGINIQEAIYKHNKKLSDRGWDYKAVVKVQVNKRIGKY